MLPITITKKHLDILKEGWNNDFNPFSLSDTHLILSNQYFIAKFPLELISNSDDLDFGKESNIENMVDSLTNNYFLLDSKKDLKLSSLSDLFIKYDVKVESPKSFLHMKNSVTCDRYYPSCAFKLDESSPEDSCLGCADNPEKIYVSASFSHSSSLHEKKSGGFENKFGDNERTYVSDLIDSKSLDFLVDLIGDVELDLTVLSYDFKYRGISRELPEGAIESDFKEEISKELKNRVFSNVGYVFSLVHEYSRFGEPVQIVGLSQPYVK